MRALVLVVILLAGCATTRSGATPCQTSGRVAGGSTAVAGHVASGVLAGVPGLNLLWLPVRFVAWGIGKATETGCETASAPVSAEETKP